MLNLKKDCWGTSVLLQKQRQITNGSYGNGVKLPLQVHRVSGNRTYFLNDKLEEVKDVDGFVSRLDNYVNDVEYFVKLTESLKQKGYANQSISYQSSAGSDISVKKKPYKGKINLEKVCINNLLAGVDRGQRDESAIRIASALKLAGLSHQDTLGEMLMWNERNQPPLTAKEIETKVESVFTHDYMFGCNDFVLRQHCDRDCKLYKSKGLELDFDPNGFVSKYLDYIDYMKIGTPYEFNVFVALSILSAAINKKVKLPFGNSYIMSNMWTVLVAPSSFMKKNVSINIGVQLLRKYNQSLFLSRVFTQEGLLDQLNSLRLG